MELIIPCVFKAIELSIDEIVKLRIKIRDNDNTVSADLLKLIKDIKKYKKKDRRLILEHVIMQLEATISRSGSMAELTS